MQNSMNHSFQSNYQDHLIFFNVSTICVPNVQMFARISLNQSSVVDSKNRKEKQGQGSIFLFLCWCRIAAFLLFFFPFYSMVHSFLKRALLKTPGNIVFPQFAYRSDVTKAIVSLLYPSIHPSIHQVEGGGGGGGGRDTTR